MNKVYCVFYRNELRSVCCSIDVARKIARELVIETWRNVDELEIRCFPLLNLDDCKYV